MESPTDISQTPIKQRFLAFRYRTSSFCCLHIFSLLDLSKSLPKDKQDFIRLWKSSLQFSFLLQRNKITSFEENSNFFLNNGPPPWLPYLPQKTICSFNRPWCSSLNEIGPQRNYLQTCFSFDGHRIFSHLNLPTTITPKRFMLFQQPSSLPASRPL